MLNLIDSQRYGITINRDFLIIFHTTRHSVLYAMDPTGRVQCDKCSTLEYQILR